jgi:hypothetical protein
LDLGSEWSNILISGLAVAFVAGGVGWDISWFRGAREGAGNGTLFGAFSWVLIWFY